MRKFGLVLVLLVLLVAVPLAWAATPLWNNQFGITTCGGWTTYGVTLPTYCGSATFNPGGRIARPISPAKACYTGIHHLSGMLYAEDWVGGGADNWYFRVQLKVDGYWHSCSVYRTPYQAYATFDCGLNFGGKANRFRVIAKKSSSGGPSTFDLDGMEMNYSCEARTPPNPNKPYFTGNHCWNTGGTWYCDAWMYVPEGYNQPYQGSLYSDYVEIHGSDYDEETRTWTLTTWYNLAACSHYATYKVVETSTQTLLDEMKLYRTPCQ